MTSCLLLQLICCQNAEPRLWPNCSKGFKSIQTTFCCIGTRGKIACGPKVELSLPQPANALNLRISQLLEAEVGGNLEKIGRKAEISTDFIILGFWENSLYSSYTRPSPIRGLCSVKPCASIYSSSLSSSPLMRISFAKDRTNSRLQRIRTAMTSSIKIDVIGRRDRRPVERLAHGLEILSVFRCLV